MPFRTFYGWLFDGNRHSPIPEPRTDDDGKVIVPDILKYNSPITHTYLISMFLRNGPLNYYLDKHFNNINVRYLDKEDLMKFIKQCVLDFRVANRETKYIGFKRTEQLVQKLRERFPQFKNSDLVLLAEIIENSDERDNIYQAYGIEVPKKQKVKKQKKMKSKKITLKQFLEDNFSASEM